MPHAYLLHGPAGIGKRVLAENLVHFLLCQRPAGGKACGQCKACQLLAAGTHPDFFQLEPEEPEKPIRVDQVRELVGFVVQTAQLGGRKVVLLEPAEAMNLNAANALLKSLEEPSGDTVLLLISHQPSRLLPTIKSRCVQQACPQPSAEQARAWLAGTLPAEPVEALDELLVLAGGSPLTALRLQGHGVREQRAQVVEGVKKLLKQQVAPGQLAESWNAVPLPLLFDWFCDWSLLILRYQLARDEEGLGLATCARSCSISPKSRHSPRCWQCRTGCCFSGRRFSTKPTSTVPCFSKPCSYSGQVSLGRARIRPSEKSARIAE